MGDANLYCGRWLKPVLIAVKVNADVLVNPSSVGWGLRVVTPCESTGSSSYSHPKIRTAFHGCMRDEMIYFSVLSYRAV